MKKLAIGALCAAMLGGCANLQNISPNDLRKPEYASASAHFDKTIPEVRQALFEHVTGCEPIGSVSTDLSGKKRIVVTEEGMGLSRASAYAVIDINADEHGGTNLQGYTYYRNAGAQRVVTRIIDAINDPAKCD